MFGGALQPQLLWADVVIGLYYNELNNDPGFLEALNNLFDTLTASGLLTDSTTDLNFCGVSYPFKPLLLEVSPSPDENPEFARWRMRDAIGMALSSFCERWHLPVKYGLEDVWHSLCSHLSVPGGGLKLGSGMRRERVPVVGILASGQVIDIDGTVLSVIDRQPWIMPYATAPFLYDPVERDRAWLNNQIEEICEQVRQSILAQADAFERQLKMQAGWRKRPPRYTDDQLRRTARALYLRAVKRLKWSDVMTQFDATLNDAEKFADRMRRWAKRCDIPLR